MSQKLQNEIKGLRQMLEVVEEELATWKRSSERGHSYGLVWKDRAIRHESRVKLLSAYVLAHIPCEAPVPVEVENPVCGDCKHRKPSDGHCRPQSHGARCQVHEEGEICSQYFETKHTKACGSCVPCQCADEEQP